jgi:hypothetical protein
MKIFERQIERERWLLDTKTRAVLIRAGIQSHKSARNNINIILIETRSESGWGGWSGGTCSSVKHPHACEAG